MTEELYLDTNIIDGISFGVLLSSNGIREILINRKSSLKNHSGLTRLSSDNPKVVNIFNQVREYFSRQIKEFHLPLELFGTEFQKKVWNKLKKIPYGETISYGELANRMGDKSLMRAVAAANGANPIPIIIPCHRVIGADRSLTGYGGGLDVKQKLLEWKATEL